MAPAAPRRRRYVAAHNKALEETLGVVENPIWGVWDKQTETWAEENVGRWYWDAQTAANKLEFQREFDPPDLDVEDRWEAVERGLRAFYKAEYLEPYLACIRSQDDWEYLTTRADVYAGQSWGEGDSAFGEGYEFALTALVECHDGPHIATCPDSRA